MADLVAHTIFLLVEGLLFRVGNVTMVLRGHVALLTADKVILGMQMLCLTGRKFAFLAFLIDTMVLIRKPFVNLDAARMGRRPRPRGGGLGQDRND